MPQYSVKSSEFTDPRTLTTPSAMLGHGVNELQKTQLYKTLENFYNKNRSDINAVMDFPGNPGGAVDDVAKAMVLLPSTINKFIKTYEGFRDANKVSADLSTKILGNKLAFLQTRYPSLYKRISKFSVDPKIPQGISGYYNYGRNEVGISPADLVYNPSSIIDTLGHESTHAQQYARASKHDNIAKNIYELLQNNEARYNLEQVYRPEMKSTLLDLIEKTWNSPIEIGARKGGKAVKVQWNKFNKMNRKAILDKLPRNIVLDTLLNIK